MSQLAIAENQAIVPVPNENYLAAPSSGSNLPHGKSVPIGEQMRTMVSWKKVDTAHADSSRHSRTDSDSLYSQYIEKALQRVRAEAEEERRIDPDLDTIPETAYGDVKGFFKSIYKSDYGTFSQIIPLPDIMPLDDGEIGLEWRKEQKIFTLSFGGDEHMVFAGIFSAESRVRGILTFSSPHLIAITSMIASLYPHYDC